MDSGGGAIPGQAPAQGQALETTVTFAASAIGTLPAEVLTTVFMSLLPVNANPSYMNADGIMSPSFALAEESLRGNVETRQDCTLQNSGCAPHTFDHFWLFPGEVLDKLHQAGAPPDRWENLTVYTHTMVAMLQESLKISIEFPNLRRLHLLGSGLNGPATRLVLALMPTKARFTLSNSTRVEAHIFIPWSDIRFFQPLPLSHLTHLMLTVNNWGNLEEFSELSAHFPAVTHLFCRFLVVPLSEQLPTAASYGTCVLPLVRTLCINASEPTIWSILCQMRIPSAVNLVLAEPSVEVRELNTAHLFSHFLSRCPKIHHLSTQFLDIERSISIIEKCKPESAVIAHSFSDFPALRTQSVECSIMWWKTERHPMLGKWCSAIHLPPAGRS
ncbi:hypothetical protein NMY22_g736 [Coprinellus aureogranulatus]|nr:hypothetical protein NMY22_g736 [Coprinellus aureogranulatus]